MRALIAFLLLAGGLACTIEARLFFFPPLREIKSYTPGMIIGGVLLGWFCVVITRKEKP